MEKFYFETKRGFLNWLFNKKAKVENNTFHHRDFLARYFGVNFLTNYEAELCPPEEDDGNFAGEEYFIISKQNHLPKQFPAVLVLSGVLDSYKEPMFNHCWVMSKDFK